VALRIAGQIRRRDGYVHDLTYDDRLDDVHQDSARVSLLVKPNEWLSNTTIFDYFRANEKGNGYILFRINQLAGLEFLDPQLLAALDAQRAHGVRSTASAVPDPYTRPEFWGVTNTTTLDLSGTLLKNIFGYRVNDIKIRGNFDGLPALFNDQVALYKTLGARNNDRALTDEFQVQGEAADVGLDYILGVFYSKLEPNGVRGITNRSFDFFGATPITSASTYATVESKAIFGQVGYDLSALLPGLKLNAGLRYTWTDTEVCGATKVSPATPTSFYTQDDCQALANAGSISILTQKEDRPTWTIGLDYQASDNVFLYVASRRGYREGGVNAPLFNSPNTTGDPDGSGPIRGADLRPYQTYEPETLTDVEFGLKSRWRVADIEGMFNIAAFRTWYKGAVQYISVAGFVDPDNGFPDRGSFGYNSGDLNMSGVEVDADIVPIAGLTLSGSASYLRQKVESANTVPPFPTPSITLPSPKWSSSAAIDYVLPVGAANDDLVFHVDYSYLGDYQVQGTDVPGYELVNGRIDWRDMLGSGFSAGVFVKNVMDEEYVAGPFLFLRQFPPNGAIYGEPRNYGLELTYRF
jgi:iron complex outermembrane receptor protein